LALADYASAIKVDDLDASAHYARAECYLMQGKEALARAEEKQAKALGYVADPDGVYRKLGL
jgi:hypothetical protein